jgi:hypothetical protein
MKRQYIHCVRSRDGKQRAHLQSASLVNGRWQGLAHTFNRALCPTRCASVLLSYDQEARCARRVARRTLLMKYPECFALATCSGVSMASESSIKLSCTS